MAQVARYHLNVLKIADENGLPLQLLCHVFSYMGVGDAKTILEINEGVKVGVYGNLPSSGTYPKLKLKKMMRLALAHAGVGTNQIII